MVCMDSMVWPLARQLELGCISQLQRSVLQQRSLIRVGIPPFRFLPFKKRFATIGVMNMPLAWVVNTYVHVSVSRELGDQEVARIMCSWYFVHLKGEFFSIYYLLHFLGAFFFSMCCIIGMKASFKNLQTRFKTGLPDTLVTATGLLTIH